MIPNKVIANTLGPVEELHDLLKSWPHGDNSNPFTMAKMLREAYDLGRTQAKAESCDVVNEIDAAHDCDGDFCEGFGCSTLRDVSNAILAK